MRHTLNAARGLWRSPIASTVSIATLAAGIGAAGVLFALVNGILLRPLPYPEPDRVVRIFDTNVEAGVDRTGAASGNIAHWRTRATAFSGIAGYYTMGRTLSGGGDAEAVATSQVSADFFAIMGVAPMAGRAFTAEDARGGVFNSAAAPVGADPVAIVSHALWMRRFAGDPAALGQTITIERRPFRIIGIMPPHFAAPDAGVQVWIPWHLSIDHPRDQHYVGAVARMRPHVTLAEAEGNLNAVAQALGDAYPSTNRGWSVRLSPLAVETVGAARPVLWVLAASVALVLLVVCANVALLSLIRGLDRGNETAVRVALGASAARLLREFMMESVVIASIGGLLGVGVAAAGVRLAPLLMTGVPRLGEVALDAPVLIFMVLVTAIAAVVSGLPPAWRRVRLSPLAGLSSGSRVVAVGATRMRSAIVVAQIALAAILLTGSGLLVRSVRSLQAVDPGFDPRGVLVLPVFLDNQHYTTGERVRTYYRTLFERLGGLTGISAVGGATTAPASPLGPDFARPVWPQDAASDESRRVAASVRMITPGYIPALRLRIVDGRPIDDRDSPQAPRVLMVSETLARRLWPGERAVGRQLVVDYSTAGTYPYEVVGVIGDVRFRGPRSEPLPEIYLPHAQRSYLIMNVVVRTTGDPRLLIPAVRAAMRDVDPMAPPQSMLALEDLVGDTYARDRLVMLTLVVFGSTAVLLAVLGVYGVLAQRVRERSREIGIRIALGAGPGRIVAWVLGAGLRLIALGLICGLGGALALGRLIDGLLFGVAPGDALTTAVALAALAAIGVAASVVPSWRASRIDPIAILRRS